MKAPQMTATAQIRLADTVTATPRLILQAEGAALLAAATLAYAQLDGNWLKFAFLFLTPDVFMLGYLISPRLAAATYNLGQSTLAPLALMGAALMGGLPMLGIGLIWLGHVGFDRLVGYGLKYPDAFQHTHLGTPFAKAQR